MPSYVVVLSEETRYALLDEASITASPTFADAVADLRAALIGALTEDEAVERMAEAIWNASDNVLPWAIPSVDPRRSSGHEAKRISRSERGRDEYRTRARAALAALHPLTDESES